MCLPNVPSVADPMSYNVEKSLLCRVVETSFSPVLASTVAVCNWFPRPKQQVCDLSAELEKETDMSE